MNLSVNKYRFLILAGLTTFCLLLFSLKSYAGEKDSNPVFVTEWVAGNSYFIQMGGTLSDVRSSLNNRDYLFCAVSYQAGGTPMGFCAANSASQNTLVSCQTTDAQFVQLIASLKGDSYVFLTATQPLSGQEATCSTIWITNGSIESPKQP